MCVCVCMCVFYVYDMKQSTWSRGGAYKYSLEWPADSTRSVENSESCLYERSQATVRVQEKECEGLSPCVLTSCIGSSMRATV